jgi:RNA polymerase sigma-70 factor (ECF subfamily)
MNPEAPEAACLWTEAVPTVSAFVASLVRNFQDRDDVLQETAVAVLQSFPSYDPARSFTAWAIGIARNQVYLYWRRLGRHRLVFDSETVNALARAFADSATSDQRLDRLGECVEALDTRDQDMCWLRYKTDLKPAAIAAQTGKGANAVAKALQRIRDRLKECVEQKALEAGS